MLMTELVRRGARYHGPKTAIMFGDDKLTFEQVDRLSNQIASVFIEPLGLAVGSRAGLLLNNSVYTIPVDFGFAKARLSRVPLNSRLSLAEQQQMLEGAGVTILLHGMDLADRARELAQAMSGLQTISIGDAANPNDLLALAKAQLQFGNLGRGQQIGQLAVRQPA